jgi:hypothetical protein
MLMKSRTAFTEHERFMQQAREQMLAFERRESEFRKQEREERAAQLRLPIEPGELH